MSAPRTAVLIVHRKNRLGHRLRFGNPDGWVRLSWQRRLALFRPGQRFGYIRWRANRYGTQDWRLYVCRAVDRGSVSRIPGIFPGADCLLSVAGKTRVKRALAWLDTLEHEGFALADVPENYWRGTQNALEIGLAPAPLTALQARVSEAGVTP